MIAAEPESASADESCRIAALVHALCDRDGIAVPDWVLAHRSDRPIPLMPAVVTEIVWLDLAATALPCFTTITRIW